MQRGEIRLNRENFTRGFLIDDELIAGVSKDPSLPSGGYLAYVLNHVTGESLGYETHPDLDSALSVISKVQRSWRFESTSGCGDPECGTGGKCSGSKCRIGRMGGCDTDACPI